MIQVDGEAIRAGVEEVAEVRFEGVGRRSSTAFSSFIFVFLFASHHQQPGLKKLKKQA